MRLSAARPFLFLIFSCLIPNLYGRSVLECGICKTIVAKSDSFATNATAVAAAIEKWEAGCQKHFPKHLKICDSLVEKAVGAFPWVHKQLTTLAWDIPEAVCSVFVPACSVECCSTNKSPEQVHLSWTEHGLDTMRASWTTLKATSTSEVQWWLEGDNKTSALGTNHTYTTAGWIGQLHTAVMHSLRRNSTYYYRVGNEVDGWSREFSFRTLPQEVGTDGRPLRIFQVGDMGYSKASDDTVNAMLKLAKAGQIDAVLHNGDVGYADGYMKHWDVFMRKIEPISSSVPYMTAPGNHEFWFNFSAYKNRFQMPNYDQYESMYWSLEVGPLHLTVLNTETIVDTANLNKIQRDWLVKDLTAADARRDEVPWVIASGHRPLYCSDHSKEQCGTFASWLRLLAEKTLNDHHVDMVIQAHEHDMQRSYPVNAGQVKSQSYESPEAPVYIVSGAGGNREAPGRTSNKTWQAWASSEVGYGMIEIVGGANEESKLRFSFISSKNGTTLDSVELTK